VVGTGNRSRYPEYHCPSYDCPRRVSIAAGVAETVVIEATRTYLEGVVGARSVKERVRAARIALVRAQEALDGAIRAFDGLDSEPAVIERLKELREARDRARERVARLEWHAGDDVLLLLDRDWDRLTVADQQRCIRAAIKAARVTRAQAGQQPRERVRIELYGVEAFDRPLPTDLG
jgi:hypothetical protein